MLAARLIWLPEAGGDIQRLFDFLVERNPRAAECAVRTILHGAECLLQHPQMGARIDDDTDRRELFIAFGAGAYVSRYRIHYDAIVVIRIWHSREAREPR